MNKQKQRRKQQEVEIIGFSIIILLLIVGVFATIASNFNTSTSSQTDKETSNKDTTSKSYVGHSLQLEDHDRNQISSIILAVSCGGKEGLIPRSKMGATTKKMLNEKGYNPTKVYNKWDYYWKRAKEMDRVNGTNCLG